MSAREVADKAIEQINKGTDFIFINFANADMVGHTSNVSSIIIAIEEIDKELERVIGALNLKNGIACITADHGNAEINIDQVTGTRHTSHTSSLVPFIITNMTNKLKNGTLADVAPTIISLFEIEKPIEMTGQSLIDF
jgi:2,3-bisphosphoglycerate-independent phosphoglycerate mutase